MLYILVGLRRKLKGPRMQDCTYFTYFVHSSHVENHTVEKIFYATKIQFTDLIGLYVKIIVHQFPHHQTQYDYEPPPMPKPQTSSYKVGYFLF